MADPLPQNFVDDVLRLIQRADGKADWYRLDRALTYGPEHYGRAESWDPYTISSGLMPAIRQLEQAGLIITHPNPQSSGRPNYAVSDSGRAYLEARAVPATASV